MGSDLIVIFEENACTIKRKTGEVLFQATMTENRMFPIDFSCAEFYGMMSSNCVDTDIWHQRYGHLYVKGLQLLVNKEMVKGLPNIKDLTRVCEGCAFGKQTRRTFPVGQAKRAQERLELVHADICGSMKTESHGGSRYFFYFS